MVPNSDPIPAVIARAIAPQNTTRITGFTMATMYRWIRSERGRAATLHPYQKGHFLGSGQGAAVLAEAGLDAQSQYQAVRTYLDAVVRTR